MSKGLHGLGCTRSKIAVPMGIVGPDAQRLLNRLVEILLVVRLLRSKEVVPSVTFMFLSKCWHFHAQC